LIAQRPHQFNRWWAFVLAHGTDYE